jgi:hypothetical protein
MAVVIIGDGFAVIQQRQTARTCRDSASVREGCIGGQDNENGASCECASAWMPVQQQLRQLSPEARWDRHVVVHGIRKLRYDVLLVVRCSFTHAVLSNVVPQKHLCLVHSSVLLSAAGRCVGSQGCEYDAFAVLRNDTQRRSNTERVHCAHTLTSNLCSTSTLISPNLAAATGYRAADTCPLQDVHDV